MLLTVYPERAGKEIDGRLNEIDLNNNQILSLSPQPFALSSFITNNIPQKTTSVFLKNIRNYNLTNF